MKKIILLLITVATLLHGQQASPENVIGAYSQRTVVIYNSSLPKSKELAEYYAEKRSIPARNLIGLKCSEAETITRQDFNATINEPLRNHFTENSWWKLEQRPEGKMCVQVGPRIFAIMQGIPLRIDEAPTYGPPDPKTNQKAVIPPAAGQSNAASVDSELMAFGLIDQDPKGPLNNAYFQKKEPFLKMALAPFFLVGRIDGPSYAEAKRLIDDALAVERIGLYGKAYIDLAQKNDAGYRMGEEWLMGSAKTLGMSGFPLTIDVRPERFPLNYPMRDCAIYLGWYVLPPDGPFLNPNFKFKKGAIACHLHSFSATTVRKTTEGWVGLMLSQGACGVFGNVFEPFLGLTVHFDKMTEALLRGFTLAEAASVATPGASWMTVVLGDPLYRPFASSIDTGKSDPEYRLFRQMVRDHPPTPGGNDKLFSALESAAAKQRSGTLYEALGQLALGANDVKRAEKYFASAVAAYQEAGDKIRIIHQRVDALAVSGDRTAAIRLLKAEMPTYAKEPEIRSLEIRLAELVGKPNP